MYIHPCLKVKSELYRSVKLLSVSFTMASERGVPGQYMVRLNELAEKSALKSGSPAHYINVNQALFQDMFHFLIPKIDHLCSLLSETRKVMKCKTELIESKAREDALLKRVKTLEENLRLKNNNSSYPSKKDEYYIVGSSIIREIRAQDLQMVLHTAFVVDLSMMLRNILKIWKENLNL